MVTTIKLKSKKATSSGSKKSKEKSHKKECLLLAFAFCLLPTVASAQIIPDATLPVNSSVTSQGGTTVITGGTVSGGNLFHSFEQFSLPANNTAYFNNTPNIQNIISRVTGSSVSNIDGLIKANGTANLFLLNPNGIIFGPNATLNIGGSFLASTASSLNFADGTSFSASGHPTTPLLTVSVPIGLQFGGNAGRIVVQGNGQGIRTRRDLIDTTVGLRVQPDQTLALVGGDVALEGATLKTAGGRIELGSVAGPGRVSLTPTNKGFSLGYEGVPTFGDIQLSGVAAVDASGEGGGDIQVQGRRVTLQDGSQIEASTLGSQLGGTLSVTASESVELIGTSANGFPSGLSTTVYQGATGTGGNLTLETGRLIVRDGAQIGTGTFGSGAGGTLAVKAKESVELIGTGSDPQFPTGLFTVADIGSTGAGGNLTLETGRLIIRDGAGVSAATLGAGRGGKVSVRANSVELIGTPEAPQLSSGLTAGSTGIGVAGDLSIETGQLRVQDGAAVTVSSTESADAGNLAVQANSIFLDNQGKITAQTASGNGGNIKLIAPNLLLRRNSQVSTDARSGTGNGGNIDINGQFIVAVPSENSDITANAVRGRGGNINITSQGIYGIQFRPSLTPLSDITASSEFGLNGIVQINTPDLDPSQGVVTLPEELVDISGLVEQGCGVAASNDYSKFTIVGRGGLPPDPNNTLSSDTVLADLGTPVVSRSLVVGRRSRAAKSQNSDQPPLVPATGWVLGDNGAVILTAQPPTATPYGSWLTTPSCHGR